jgi:hypothetical protein
MHPLALPALVATALLAFSTLYAAWSRGSPLRAPEMSVGRLAVALGVATYAATLALWSLRWLGWFGGPVHVG